MSLTVELAFLFVVLVIYYVGLNVVIFYFELILEIRTYFMTCVGKDNTNKCLMY